MTNPFLSLGLPEPLALAVSAMGYEMPTPVQIQAIPALLEGHDILAAAQTGTGKTAAFALPILARMLASPKTPAPGRPRALVLAPTRELAAQIEENIRAYAARTHIKTAIVFGGVNIKPQIEALSSGIEFLVATPGRLLDHIGQKTADISEIEYLVLDEADRMLDMGFIHDIRKILRLVPEKRQTLLFSATFSKEIRELADTLLAKPVVVEISRNRESALVEQEAWLVDRKGKRNLLRDLIVDNNWDQVLVFTRMKHSANRLAEQITRDGISAAAIHGNKSQSARTRALQDFKTHAVRVLVATDIAARGLDIEGLPHVVNYELPNVPEDYVHRIGRTGRAGVNGHAVSFVAPEEAELLRAIEKLIRHEIPAKKAEGYEAAAAEEPAPAAGAADAGHTEKPASVRRPRRQQQKPHAEKHESAPAGTAAKNSGAKEAASVTAAAEKPAGNQPRIKAETGGRNARGDSLRTGERKQEGRKAPAATGRSGADKGSPKTAGNAARQKKAVEKDDDFGNRIDYKPSRRRGSTAQYEPYDPFDPRHQSLSLPQRMLPAVKGNRSGGRSRSGYGRYQDNPRYDRNIKSTVERVTAPRADPGVRYESVSSNLPPGMVLKFRRR